MKALTKIIRQKDIDEIFGAQEFDGIEAGELTNFDPKKVKAIMNLLASRLDKIIGFDKDVNGKYTRYSQQALAYRGFTYEEYGALFNTELEEKDFPFYPVFNQVRKPKGGVVFEKQRKALLIKYDYNVEDYVKILCDEGYQPVLDFFFGTWAKLNAMLPRQMLQMHTYIFAPTGSGKSELMRVLFYRMQKKFKKFSLVMIDPHGELAEKVKRFSLNKGNNDRLIYLDVYFRDGYTFTINPFEITTRSIKNINYQGEQIISILEEALNRDGSRLSEPQVNMMEKAVYFLLNRPNSSILDLVNLLGGNEILVQEAYEDDEFFNQEFLKPANKTRTALKARIERFLNSSVLKNLLVGQSTFELEEALNSSKVIIFNLDGMPEFSQVIIGKIIIARIRSILRKRKKDGKMHTIMFIDECQNFVTDSYEKILSQMRKYGLHLVLANQYVEQLDRQAKAVKKNTAIKIGASDDMDDIKDMIKLPKDASLNDYEFFLKVRNRTLTKFKSPDILLKNRKKYELNKTEENKLDQLMLSRYYKVVGKKEHKKRVEKPHTLVGKSTTKVIESNTAVIPPFRLLINEND